MNQRNQRSRIYLDLQRERDPNVTLHILAESIATVGLTIANRARRNRSALWQKKHLRDDGSAPAVMTRQRDSKHAQLNWPITEHYRRFLGAQRLDESTAPPVLGFGIGDLTANPFRPHYDQTIPSVWTDANPRLFMLDDEPIGHVEYTLLCCYLSNTGKPRFQILHNVLVSSDGRLPRDIPAGVQDGLVFWAACPPILEHGVPSLSRFAVLDYDVRHYFGFTRTPEEYWTGFYHHFQPFSRWQANLLEKQSEFESTEAGYHAILGTAANGDLVLLHRYGAIAQLASEVLTAGEMLDLAVQDAVLLDSGGSCCVWSNWANRDGAVIASHQHFREHRGAMVFLTQP